MRAIRGIWDSNCSVLIIMNVCERDAPKTAIKSEKTSTMNASESQRELRVSTIRVVSGSRGVLNEKFTVSPKLIPLPSYVFKT